ncbi:MAG: Smr/MutS family protein, partial [Peptococcaceae bacterium]|nr:Smr/MutS family protein [Peptococcaceae bacterium]
LKTFAYQTDGVQNASMAFDIETLQPTYRLMIGVSGESNAFAIAQKLGLRQEIIDNAKDILESNQNELVDKVKNLEKIQRQLNEQEQLFAIEREQFADDKRILNARLEEIERERSRMEREANQKAVALLEETKKKIQSVNDELKELRKKDSQQAAVGLSALKKDIDASLDKAKPKRKQIVHANAPLTIDSVRVGDEVYLNNFNMNATVLAVDKQKKSLEVQAGIMKSTVKLKDVSKASKKKNRVTATTKRPQMKVKSVASEIDLRGMTVDEALRAVDHFIDDAYLNNLSQIHIIHGKGTGALRKAINDKLNASKYVKQHHYAPANEGGDGATIAILK